MTKFILRSVSEGLQYRLSTKAYLFHMIQQSIDRISRTFIMRILNCQHLPVSPLHLVNSIGKGRVGHTGVQWFRQTFVLNAVSFKSDHEVILCLTLLSLVISENVQKNTSVNTIQFNSIRKKWRTRSGLTFM